MATKKVRQTNLSKAQIMAIIKASADSNKKDGSKAFYTDKGAEILASAIARALTLPTLASVGIGNAKGDADARRKFCRKVRATAIEPSKVLRKNTSDRPENAIDQRLMSIAVEMKLDKKAFYAVRSNSTSDDSEPKVFIICR